MPHLPSRPLTANRVRSGKLVTPAGTKRSMDLLVSASKGNVLRNGPRIARIVPMSGPVKAPKAVPVAIGDRGNAVAREIVSRRAAAIPSSVVKVRGLAKVGKNTALTAPARVVRMVIAPTNRGMRQTMTATTTRAN